MEEIINIIGKTISSLELIEVHGRQNLALLYNSIDALTQLKLSLNNPHKEVKEINVADNTVK